MSRTRTLGVMLAGVWMCLLTGCCYTCLCVDGRVSTQTYTSTFEASVDTAVKRRNDELAKIFQELQGGDG